MGSSCLISLGAPALPRHAVVARVLLVPPEMGPAGAADAGASDAAPSASSGGKGGKSGGGKRKGGGGGAGANGSAGGAGAAGDAARRRVAAAEAVLVAPVLQQQLTRLQAQEGAGAAQAPASEVPAKRAMQLVSATGA